jgi:hypothetical protein
VVAVEVFFPDSGRLEIGDTLYPSARALNGHGDSVAAQVFWTSLDTGIVAVDDSATGVTISKAVGTGRLQARFGGLRSNPENVFVFVRLDSASVLPGVDLRDTVTVSAPDSLSDSLSVKAWAGTSGAPGRPVVYTAAIYPAGATAFTFVPKATVQTDANGIAVARFKFKAAPVPDSVVVSAAVKRPNGSDVPGSPVRFVVEFRP